MRNCSKSRISLENTSLPSLTQPRNLSPRTSRSVTPEYTNDMIQANVEARDRLLALGGRPLRPLNFDPAPWDPSRTMREEHHIRNHWNEESDTCKPELARWEAFRAAQKVARADALKFSELERAVRKYRIKHGFRGPIRLHLEPEQQTALNEWKEYQVFQHCHLATMERDVQQARHTLTEEASKGHLEGGNRRDLVILVTDVDRAEAKLRSWNDYLEWIEQQRSVIAAEESNTQRNTSRHSGRKRITQKSSLSTVSRRKIWKSLGGGRSRVAKRNSDATANTKGLKRQGRESRTAFAPRRSKRIAEIT